MQTKEGYKSEGTRRPARPKGTQTHSKAALHVPKMDLLIIFTRSIISARSSFRDFTLPANSVNSGGTSLPSVPPTRCMNEVLSIPIFLAVEFHSKFLVSFCFLCGRVAMVTWKTRRAGDHWNRKQLTGTNGANMFLSFLSLPLSNPPFSPLSLSKRERIVLLRLLSGSPRSAGMRSYSAAPVPVFVVPPSLAAPCVG